MAKNKYSHLKFILLFPSVILYFEILFRLFTGGNIFSLSFLPLLFFSLAYGGIGYLLSSLHKNKRVNKRIAAVLLFLACIPYIVQFLIYKQFKQLFSAETLDNKLDGSPGKDHI